MEKFINEAHQYGWVVFLQSPINSSIFGTIEGKVGAKYPGLFEFREQNGGANTFYSINHIVRISRWN